MDFVGSQIETKQIFNIAGLITSLRRCRLGTENLDNLVLILKNWPEDARTDCYIAKSRVEEFLMSEDNIIEDNEELIMDAGMLKEK